MNGDLIKLYADTQRKILLVLVIVHLLQHNTQFIYSHWIPTPVKRFMLIVIYTVMEYTYTNKIYYLLILLTPDVLFIKFITIYSKFNVKRFYRR